MKHQTIYINLLAKFEKVFAHNRQGSYRTKYRYAEAFKRFLAYLAEEYRLERIANIAPKHIYGYTEYLNARGLTTAYIKTELSAIRFFHDQIPRARHRLPDNADLNLGRRRFGGVDRTWSGREFNLFLVTASELGREDYVAILCLARYAALRQRSMRGGKRRKSSRNGWRYTGTREWSVTSWMEASWFRTRTTPAGHISCKGVWDKT